MCVMLCNALFFLLCIRNNVRYFVVYMRDNVSHVILCNLFCYVCVTICSQVVYVCVVYACVCEFIVWICIMVVDEKWCRCTIVLAAKCFRQKSATTQKSHDTDDDTKRWSRTSPSHTAVKCWNAVKCANLNRNERKFQKHLCIVWNMCAKFNNHRIF